jgi:hypothetical protein
LNALDDLDVNNYHDKCDSLIENNDLYCNNYSELTEKIKNLKSVHYDVCHLDDCDKIRNFINNDIYCRPSDSFCFDNFFNCNESSRLESI